MIIIFNFKDGREGLTRQSMLVSEKTEIFNMRMKTCLIWIYSWTRGKIILKNKTLTPDDDEQVEIIEAKITDEIATREFEILKKITGDLDINTSIWKELRKAFPPISKPIPTGIINVTGKLITNPQEKNKVTLEHFKYRRRKREIKDEVNDMEKLNSELFEKRVQREKVNHRIPFDIVELDNVKKSLKLGKCRDPDNYM